MKRLVTSAFLLCLVPAVVAGFKVKLIKPKKPAQFQASAVLGGVTWAADLLIDEGRQKDYFYKGLTPVNVVAVRLAIFNSGSGEILLPVAGIGLRDPEGRPLTPVDPSEVARCVLQGKTVTAEPSKKSGPVTVTPSVRNPRTDPTDPRYDPRYDPSDPRYDPRHDPRYDPSDPRYDPRTDPRPGMGTPTVDVVVNPRAGGRGQDLSKYEKSLVEKDFRDKAHSEDPVDPATTRDRFLFFSITVKPGAVRGYTLHVPKGKGIPEEIVLKF